MGRGAATSPSLYGSQLRGPIGSWVVRKGALCRCHEAPSPFTPPHTLACHPPALFCSPQDRLTARSSV